MYWEKYSMKNILKKETVVGFGDTCIKCGAKLKEEKDIPICENCNCVR